MNFGSGTRFASQTVVQFVDVTRKTFPPTGSKPIKSTKESKTGTFGRNKETLTITINP